MKKLMLIAIVVLTTAVAAAPTTTDSHEAGTDQLLRLVDLLAKSGQMPEAKRLMAEFTTLFGDVEAIRKANNLRTELEIVDKPVPVDLGIEAWYQGGAEALSGNRATVLVFWEEWCPFSRRYVPELQRLQNSLGRRGVQIVGLTSLSGTSTGESVRQFVKKSGVGFPIAKEDGTAKEYFGAAATPAAAVIQDGKVVWRGHPMKLTESVLSSFLPQPSPDDAYASQTFCNRTSEFIWVAVMGPEPDDHWRARGWYLVAPGDCTTPWLSSSHTRFLRWQAFTDRSTKDKTVWTGGIEGCVPMDAFNVKLEASRDQCQDKGTISSGWRQLDRGEARHHSLPLTLRPDLPVVTPDEARQAGIDAMYRRLDLEPEISRVVHDSAFEGVGVPDTARERYDRWLVADLRRMVLEEIDEEARQPSKQHFCNKTPEFVWFGVMFSETSDSWHAKGWYQAAPGECITPWVSKAPRKTIWWTAKTDSTADKKSTWHGELDDCVPSGKFDYVLQQRKSSCDDENRESAGWHKIDRGDSKENTQSLVLSQTPDLTLEQAAREGMARMLRRLGKDASATAITAALQSHRQAHRPKTDVQLNRDLLKTLRQQVIDKKRADRERLLAEKKRREAQRNTYVARYDAKAEKRKRRIGMIGNLLKGAVGGYVQAKTGRRPNFDGLGGSDFGSNGSSTAIRTGSCPTNLRHVAGKFPVYNDSGLRRVRQIALDTDLRQALSSARSMGYTPQRAAAAALQQARLADDALRSAESCIRQVATNPSAVIRQLQSGTYRFGSGTISDNCAKAYINFYYQAVANRASATALACLANQ